VKKLVDVFWDCGSCKL